MKLISLLAGLFLLLCLPINAQNDSTATTKEARKKKVRTIELYGEVYDSFTKAKVKAFITLMHTDSTTVDTTTCMTWSTMSYYSLKVPAVQDDFIIKATADGYEDTFLNYHLRHIARNSYFELPRILMKKKQDEIWRECTRTHRVVEQLHPSLPDALMLPKTVQDAQKSLGNS